MMQGFWTTLSVGRLLLISLCLAAPTATFAAEAVVIPVDRDGVQRLSVLLDNYAYVPRHLIVQAGVPVELILKSQTFITPHNFIIREPSVGLIVEADIGGGDTKIVRFTADQPGTYPFYCDKKLLFFKSHREKGMEGVLEVR